MTDPQATADAATRVEQIFADAGAYRTGHFKLKSGRHGDRYIEKFEVLQWPQHVTELCRLIVDRSRNQRAEPGRPPDADRFARSGPRPAAEEKGPVAAGPAVDVVVGPTTGGVILAYECARQLGVRGIFAEEVTDANGATRRELRRGFAIAPGERVLLVDDVITTGGSLLAMLPVVERAGGEIARIAVLVDRSGGLHEVTSPETGRRYLVDALWSLSLPTYEAGSTACPGCAAGAPVIAPGSTGTKRPGPAP